MFCVSLPSRFSKQLFLIMGAIIFIAAASAPLRAQRSNTTENQPAFSEFRGVRIGMATDEARKKLGSPRDKSAEQDFYLFNDNQAVQVFYDKGGAVAAISIDYMDGASGIPSAKEVLGSEADSKPDGSVYKLIRYPKAGYWVSYSRTAGSSPTTTITIQKIEH